LDEPCFLLESLNNSAISSRYSFLATKPKLKVEARNNQVFLTSNKQTTMYKHRIDQYLDQHTKPNQVMKLDHLPYFTGGYVGYFNYSYSNLANEINHSFDNDNYNDVELYLFNQIIAFDHLKQKLFIIVTTPTKDFKNEYSKAIDEIAFLKKIIYTNKPFNYQGHPTSSFSALYSQNEYEAKVKQALNYIKEGQIFQVVLANKFQVAYEGDFLATYRSLRSINPSSYMFYLDFKQLQIIGSSPETLISLQNHKITTYPIAGTIKRDSLTKDSTLIKQLLSNPKDLVEHDMLVDLASNDVGKIACFNSIKLEDYLKPLILSHVIHITSTISGQLP
ncbi:MAG: chorismate-binding protein, partial [Bacilli bacterium]